MLSRLYIKNSIKKRKEYIKKQKHDISILWDELIDLEEDNKFINTNIDYVGIFNVVLEKTQKLIEKIKRIKKKQKGFYKIIEFLKIRYDRISSYIEKYKTGRYFKIRFEEILSKTLPRIIDILEYKNRFILYKNISVECVDERDGLLIFKSVIKYYDENNSPRCLNFMTQIIKNPSDLEKVILSHKLQRLISIINCIKETVEISLEMIINCYDLILETYIRNCVKIL